MRAVAQSLADSKEFIQRMYTRWTWKNEKIDTQYGVITFENWLKEEKNRIESRGGACTIWKNGDYDEICMTLDHSIEKNEKPLTSKPSWLK